MTSCQSYYVRPALLSPSLSDNELMTGQWPGCPACPQLSVRQVKTKMILVPLVSCVLVWHIETVTGCKGGGGEPKQLRSTDDETGDLALAYFTVTVTVFRMLNPY